MARVDAASATDVRRERLPGVLGRALAERRKRRLRSLLAAVQTWDAMRVIDVGCGRDGRSTTDFVPADWAIVGVDVLPPSAVHHRHPGFRYVQGDAADLSAFRDGEFDLALAVGLLEHLVDPAAFARAAAEIQRVARQFALVVPYRYGWVEPHYLVPMFPVLPRTAQNGLVRAFDLKGQRAAVRRDPAYIGRRTCWRTNAQLRAAFPGSQVRLTPTLETVAITRGLDAPGSRP